MTDYIIISPTLSRAFYYFDHARRLLALYYHLKAWRRNQHMIEIGDVRLRFMAKEQYEKGNLGLSGDNVMADTQFEKLLMEFLQTEFREVHIGDKVRFDVFKDARSTGFKNCGELIVVGTVVYINEEHRWFSAEYELEGTKQRLSFKFDQVGDCVTIVKKKERKNG